MLDRIKTNMRTLSIKRITLTLLSLPFVAAGFVVGLLSIVVRFAVGAFLEGYQIAMGVMNAPR